MSDTTRVPYRGLITAFAMLAMFMQTLDSTIANVALPYMQGSMSASYDEITWVLTSYVIAAAIMTAPVGWMAVRFGRKRLFVTCITGFTVVSMMCGAAQSLEQLVIFRLLQGMFGAALALWWSIRRLRRRTLRAPNRRRPPSRRRPGTG